MSNYGPVSTNHVGAHERTCLECGKRFRTDNARQRYCSRKCKRTAQNRRCYQRRSRK